MQSQKVIFDTDPGVDDALALLYLHRHPAIDLVGITTVFGNAPIEVTTRNARFLAREWDIIAPVECPPFRRTPRLLGLSSDELPGGAHPER